MPSVDGECKIEQRIVDVFNENDKTTHPISVFTKTSHNKTKQFVTIEKKSSVAMYS